MCPSIQPIRRTAALHAGGHAPVALLTQGHLAESCSLNFSDGLPVLDLTEAIGSLGRAAGDQPRSDAIGLTPSHLAYIIYTSGSTGTPKGSWSSIGDCAIMFTAQKQAFSVVDDSQMLQFASFSFDVSHLGNDAGVVPRSCVASFSVKTRCRQAMFWPKQSHITPSRHATLPPAVLTGLSEEAISRFHGSCSYVAGDMLPSFTGATVGVCGRQLINAMVRPRQPYAPRCMTCHSEQSGNPSDRSTDREHADLHSGWAWGAGAGGGGGGVVYRRGGGGAWYLNRPELTAERFVQDPFVR